MKKTNVLKLVTAKIIFSLACATLFSGAAFGQIKLHNAMDLSGDGKADYNIFRSSTGTFHSRKSDGTGATGLTFGVANTDTPAPGDYDGDGRGDIAVWRYSNGTFYYLNSSTNTYGGRQFGLVGDELVQRDYDGDGKTDFAVVRRTAGTSGTMTWYINNSSTNTLTGAQFGLASDQATPGDFDGDGKFDIAVQRAGGTSAATTYVLGSAAGVYGVQFGLGTDLVAPGDYDGDGKTDQTAVRRTTGGLVWYILNSTTNQLTAVTFGAAETDTPVQNDYDGDGKTDIAVWRETDGTFNVRQSSNNAHVSTPWGYTSDIPLAGYDVH